MLTPGSINGNTGDVVETPSKKTNGNGTTANPVRRTENHTRRLFLGNTFRFPPTPV